MTRSMRSGSEMSLSMRSDSAGGSCMPTLHSRPYVMCSATDAASAAIDYSRGNVEEGVVDSPPSRGPLRTPICSPSPLKHTASTPGRQNTEVTPQRKLYADPSELPSNQVDDNTKNKLGPCDELPRVEDSGFDSLQSTRSGSITSVGPSFRRRVVRDNRRSASSCRLGSVHVYRNSVPRSAKMSPPELSKSLSFSEMPRSTATARTKESKSLSLGACTAISNDFELPRRSRRDDIFRGLAKEKAILESRKFLISDN